MKIVTKLKLFAVLTLMAQGTVLLATVVGPGAAKEAEYTALRRETYCRQLVEIKASAGVDQVAASVREQKSASTEIARNAEAIAGMAEKNSAASKESSVASMQLEQLARALKGAIGRFKV